MFFKVGLEHLEHFFVLEGSFKSLVLADEANSEETIPI
jgi:hypothetical protein